MRFSTIQCDVCTELIQKDDPVHSAFVSVNGHEQFRISDMCSECRRKFQQQLPLFIKSLKTIKEFKLDEAQ